MCLPTPFCIWEAPVTRPVNLILQAFLSFATPPVSGLMLLLLAFWISTHHRVDRRGWAKAHSLVAVHDWRLAPVCPGERLRERKVPLDRL